MKYGDIVASDTYVGQHCEGKFLREYEIAPEEHPSKRFHKRVVVQWLSRNNKLLVNPQIDDLSLQEIYEI